MSSEKREKVFYLAHDHKWELKISTGKPLSDTATAYLRRFCHLWDREKKDGQERKPAETAKHFEIPYQLELYSQHLKTWKLVKWNEYLVLSVYAEQTFWALLSSKTLSLLISLDMAISRILIST